MPTPQETAINGAFDFMASQPWCKSVAILCLIILLGGGVAFVWLTTKKIEVLAAMTAETAQIREWSRETANELVDIKNQLTIMNNDAMNAAKREDRMIALLERINDNLARTVSGLRRNSPLALHNDPRDDILIKTNYEK